MPTSHCAQRRTTTKTKGHPTGSIRPSVPTMSPSTQQITDVVEWMREHHPPDNERWSGSKGLEEGNSVWSPTRAHPHKMCESVALFCTAQTHTHRTPTENTTYTQHTDGTHTHTLNTLQGSRVRGGPWFLWGCCNRIPQPWWIINKDDSGGWDTSVVGITVRVRVGSLWTSQGGGPHREGSMVLPNSTDPVL